MAVPHHRDTSTSSIGQSYAIDMKLPHHPCDICASSMQIPISQSLHPNSPKHWQTEKCHQPTLSRGLEQVQGQGVANAGEMPFFQPLRRRDTATGSTTPQQWKILQEYSSHTSASQGSHRTTHPRMYIQGNTFLNPAEQCTWESGAPLEEGRHMEQMQKPFHGKGSSLQGDLHQKEEALMPMEGLEQ